MAPIDSSNHNVTNINSNNNNNTTNSKNSNNSNNSKSSSKSKTIKTPGSNSTRVSVACDRCRKKKIRCFYDDDDNGHNSDINNNDFNVHGEKRPCANCKAVGLECIFTDKLARKAFPRGYTESLEERVRELEYENKKLQKLLSLKNSNNSESNTDGQLKANDNGNNKINVKMEDVSPKGSKNFNTSADIDMDLDTKIKDLDNDLDIDNNIKIKREALEDSFSRSGSEEPSLSNSNSNIKKLNIENLSILNNQQGQVKSLDHHLHDETCNCGNYPHSVHNRPVSIAGSIDIDNGDLSDDEASSIYSTPDSISHNFHYSKFNINSFEQINAPGAAAAISLQNKLRTKNFLNLANLIAASIPRSTEETLFIPNLFAKLVNVHGFNSKAPYLTARSIALLKEAYNEENRYNLYPITFQSTNFNEIKKEESIQFFQSLNLPNHMNLDLCITIFFNTWNTIIPILNKEIFMNNYIKFNKSRETKFLNGELIGFEKFGELLVIITTLVMLSNERNNIGETIKNDLNNISSGNSEILQYYDHLIKEFIKSNMSSLCSISSLQIVTIELLYCLATGDLNTSYELRGKMITMSQQLRLHRCPAAVLGYNGSSVSKLQQGERRILFWCIYTLDSFNSFILGVPRLLKDYEIECALPSSSSSQSENKDSDINLITFNNNIQLSLVGKVCDSALSVMRYSKILGTIVDTIFRRNNGLKQSSFTESTCLLLEDMLDSWKRNLPSAISFDLLKLSNNNLNDFDKLNDTQLTLLYLYYQTKALIYMPLLANESSNSKCSPAYISIQQATTAILMIFKILNTPKHNFYFLPLPMNISRQMARFSLLAARNSLEYTRGGALFQEAKNLLSSVISELKLETSIGLLGCLSKNCIVCLEHAVDSIMSQPKLNSNNNSSNSNNNNSNTVDPIESLKKDTKKRSNGSPLKNVAISDDNSDDNESYPVKNDESALNDIFSTKSNGNYHLTTLQQQMRQPVNAKSPQPQQPQQSQQSQQQQQSQQPLTWNPDNMGSYNQLEEIKLNKDLKSLPSGSDLFSFLSADPKQQEEQSLNSMLQQVDDNEIVKQQQLLLLKKQQLQKQQDLQKQIQLQQQQAHLSQESQEQNTQSPTGDLQFPSILSMDSIKSYSDLLMLNDFGVDASLGLPFMDFDFDTTQSKKQKLDDVSYNSDSSQQHQHQRQEHNHSDNSNRNQYSNHHRHQHVNHHRPTYNNNSNGMEDFGDNDRPMEINVGSSTSLFNWKNGSNGNINNGNARDM